jgi:hypothetical protein
MFALACMEGTRGVREWGWVGFVVPPVRKGRARMGHPAYGWGTRREWREHGQGQEWKRGSGRSGAGVLLEWG